MKISYRGITLIKKYESLHDGNLTVIGLQPKMCPAGIWTIGWGHAMTYDGRFLKGEADKFTALQIHTSMSISEAEKLLAEDLVKFENQVNSLGIFLNQNQFDALVSFVFNVGFGAFKGSTLLKRIISGVGDVTAAFGMWNKCNKEELKGLTLRRSDEAKLYLS